MTLPDCFTTTQLAPFAREKVGRWDPRAKSVEHLGIDWSPAKSYFTTADINASF